MMTPGKGGVLPSQAIHECTRNGIIRARNAIDKAQIQPASLDLQLGGRAHWLQASFLPGPDSLVEDKLDALSMATIDLTEPTVLHRGCVYLIELEEHIALPAMLCARANPKSTTGRLDVFTRLVTDSSGVFDYVTPRYNGRLYAEVMPRTFNVRVQAGLCLSQLRLIANEADAAVTDRELLALDAQETLVYANEGSENAVIDRGIWLSVNLEATTPHFAI